MSGRFANLDPSRRCPDRSFGMLPRAIRELRRPRRFDGPERFLPPDVVRPDLSRLVRDDGRLRVIWLGHAGCLVRLGGRLILTDPVEGLPRFVRRRTPAPFRVSDLPELDLVLISHSHYDHLDLPTLRKLVSRSRRFVAAEGVGRWLTARGVPAEDLPWWQSMEVDGLRLTAVPAHHWSRRGLFDSNRAHWCGFVLEGAGRRVYFAGDTAWFEGFAGIRERYSEGLDLALLPIGAYHPPAIFAGQHINPEQAGEAARTLGARHTLGVHHGTFQLTFEPLGEPALWARAWWDGQAAAAPGELHLPPIGGLVEI